jgi:hypothetical protein
MADTLHRLEAEIAEKQAKLAELQAELQELETAVRVIRRIEGAGANGAPSVRILQPSRPPSPRQNESAKAPEGRKTVRQFAVEILTELGPTHYREIAKEAVRRGFVSVQSSDPDAPLRSFMSLIYRDSETFESRGRGIFGLKTHGAGSGKPSPH